MKISRLAIYIAILLSVLYVGSELTGNMYAGKVLRACIIPFVIIFYVLEKRTKSKYFFVFLITFSLSFIMPLLKDITSNNLLFILANSLCVIGYLAMIFEIGTMIFQKISVKKLLTKYPLYIIVLVVLGALLAGSIINMPRSSIVWSRILIGNIYLAAIFTLLGFSFLNYIIRYSEKALTLFVASICMVFSEVLQIANYYIFSEPKLILMVIYLILQVAGFYLFIKQAFMLYPDDNEETVIN